MYTKTFLTNKFYKYIIYTLFIFFLICYVPKNKICISDSIFITILLLFLIYFFENINNKYNYKNKELEKKNTHSSNEHFDENTNESFDINKEEKEKEKEKEEKLEEKTENKNTNLINKYNNDGIITKEIIDDVIKDLDNNKVTIKLQNMAKKDDKFRVLLNVIETNKEKVKYLNENEQTEKILKLVEEVYNRTYDKNKKLANYFNNNEKEYNKDNIQPSNECEAKIEKYLEKLFKEGKYFDRNGILQNVMNNDMRYNQLTDEQMQPLGSNDITMNNSWENDYVLLNTEKWKVPITSPYKCKQEKECPVCPSLTSGYPINLKDFNNARKIMPPDNINVDYIKDRLNSGEF